jgi:LacI family gluconate utilization system Gnt-I transcriptional repressor
LAGEQPDVIFYLNDHMAFGGQVACEAKGLSVPHDIGLVGFNALDLSGVLPVPLTTVKTPRRLMGITGARNLLARIHGVQPQKSVALPVEIVEGGTTRLQ